MIEQLKELGFGTIAIADDSEENIQAAMQLEERLPGIQFEFYRRGDLIIPQIHERHDEIGLILTDRQMETDDAGLDVVEVAWDYLIPAYIVSGGYEHAGKPRLRTWPGLRKTYIPDGQLKDDPETWYMILESIVQDADKGDSDGAHLLKTLLLAKKCGIPKLDYVGETARKLAEHYLKNDW